MNQLNDLWYLKLELTWCNEGFSFIWLTDGLDGIWWIDSFAKGSFNPGTDGNLLIEMLDFIDRIDELEGMRFNDGFGIIFVNEAFEANESSNGSSLFIIEISGFAVTTVDPAFSRTSMLSLSKSVCFILRLRNTIMATITATRATAPKVTPIPIFIPLEIPSSLLSLILMLTDKSSKNSVALKLFDCENLTEKVNLLEPFNGENLLDDVNLFDGENLDDENVIDGVNLFVASKFGVGLKVFDLVNIFDGVNLPNWVKEFDDEKLFDGLNDSDCVNLKEAENFLDPENLIESVNGLI